MTALGAKPMLAWIDKTLLSIEASYQRTLSAKRSQSLIGKLAAGFCWAHCAPLIVAAKGPKGNGGWVIIDGQRRDDIKDLPCYVVTAADLKAQAQAFVAHNRDRVALTSLSLFHADVAAGEAASTGVIAAAAAAGVTIPRTPVTLQTMGPDQCAATGVLSRIFVLDGPARLTDVLMMIREAHPNAQGQLRGRTIGAVAAILRHAWLGRAALVKALQRNDGQRLENEARAASVVHAWSLNESFVAMLVAAGGGLGPDAVAALRAEEKERGRAKLKEIYEAGRADRERRREEREAAKAEGHAKRAEAANRKAAAVIAGKKARKPFTFTRSSKPAVRRQPSPAVIAGDVPVRRFEMGASGLGNDEFLQRCGFEVVKRPRGYEVKKVGAKGRPTKMTHRELTDFLDEQRVARGLLPLNRKAS